MGRQPENIIGEGNVIAQVDGNGAVTQSSYDPLGRLVAQTNPVSGTTVYTYNATEQIALQDPAGNVTQSSYSPAGRLIQSTDATGATTQYQYDPAGNTVVITSGSPLTATQVETRTYDALNRIITDAIGGAGSSTQTTQTAYDQDGNVAQQSAPNGDVTFNTYDLANELLLTEIDPAVVTTATGTTEESYSYDAAGNLAQSTDFDNRTQHNSYDAANRLMQTTSSFGGATTLTTTYGYDPDGNQVSRLLTQTIGGVPTTTHTYTATVNAADWLSSSREDGLLTAYGYDGAGQQRTQTILNSSPPVTTTLNAEGLETSQVEGAFGQGPYPSSFGYNANDLPLTETLPGGSGIQAGYGYDGDSRLITQTLSGPATATVPLSSSYAYAYNPAGWTTALTSTLNGVTTTQTFSHDALGRLTAVQGTGATTPLSVTYDGNGNILSTLTNGITTTYYYSSTYPNLLLATYTAGQASATYYTYDATGHVLSITNTLTGTMGIRDSLGYDLQGRLVAIGMKDGTLVSWGYNSAGQRSSYTVSKADTISLQQTFQYRGDQLAEATISTTAGYTTDSYLYDQSGNPLELIRVPRGQAPQRYWYETDGRGNVVALTDLTGTVVDRYSYDAWGAPTSISEAVPQRLRYAGYWYDQELGTYWVSVREYAPTLKRWLAPDPSQQDGVRTYVYAEMIRWIMRSPLSKRVASPHVVSTAAIMVGTGMTGIDVVYDIGTNYMTWAKGRGPMLNVISVASLCLSQGDERPSVRAESLYLKIPPQFALTWCCRGGIVLLAPLVVRAH